MQQLDLFNDETGKKIAVIKPKQRKPEIDKQPGQEETVAPEPEPEGQPETEPATETVKLIKPFSKVAEQPSKRGRKSLKEFAPDLALLDIPEDEILFQKQYYSISEVAGWFNMKPSLLRFWENEFDILKPRKNKKGDRLFRPEDVKNLRIIYHLLRQKKYSIEGARQFLKDNQKKAELQMQLLETLTKFRSFLLELKANLGT